MPFIALPPDARSVVIAGAGGFALEVADYLLAESRQGGLPVAGVLVDADHYDARHLAAIALPYLGTITDFRASDGQVVVVAVGTPQGRRAMLERLWAHHNPTPAFVHENCVISPSSTLERASIVCPFSIVNRHARLHAGSMLNVHCSVGHGAQVGAFSVLCPFSALNGDAVVGSDCFLGTRATIYPRITIGEGCMVDSHTGVRINAGDQQVISHRGSYRVNPRRGV